MPPVPGTSFEYVKTQFRYNSRRRLLQEEASSEYDYTGNICLPDVVGKNN